MTSKPMALPLLLLASAVGCIQAVSEGQDTSSGAVTSAASTSNGHLTGIGSSSSGTGGTSSGSSTSAGLSTTTSEDTTSSSASSSSTGSSTSAGGTSSGSTDCIAHQQPCNSSENLCPPVTTCDFGNACGVIGNACNTSEDCCGGNICSPQGLCIIDDTISYCNVGTDCATGVCSESECVCQAANGLCANDLNCCSGTCRSGQCAANTTLHDACAAPSQCASTESCQQGACCIPNVSTEFCNSNADCCAGDCQGGLCAQLQGGPCGLQTDCYPGWICNGGQCTSRPG